MKKYYFFHNEILRKKWFALQVFVSVVQAGKGSAVRHLVLRVPSA